MKRVLALLLAVVLNPARAAPEAAVQPLDLGAVSAYPGALALSWNGRIAAHVTADGDVRLWEVSTLQRLPGLPASGRPASSVAVNADGTALVVGYRDGRLLLWRPGETAPVREFFGHSGRILTVAIAPDGSRVASGSEDGTTQLFDLATGRRLHILDSVYNGHPVEGVAAPVAVTFAAGGRVLLTEDWQRRQYDVGRVGTLWDTQQGLELATFEVAPPNGDESLQTGQAVGGGGWLLVTTGLDQLTVRRLDGCGPARPVGVADSDGMDSGRYADSVAADPLGRWVAAASEADLRFFAVSDGGPPQAVSLPGHALALAPLPDGRSLLAVLDTTPRHGGGPRMTDLHLDSPTPPAAQLFRIAVPPALLAAPPLHMAAGTRPCPPDEATRRRHEFTLPDPANTLAVRTRLSPNLPPTLGDPPLPLGPLQRLHFDALGRLSALYLAIGDTRAAVVAWTLPTGRQALARELPRQLESAQPLWLGTDWAVSSAEDGGWRLAATGQRLLDPGDSVEQAQVTADAERGRLYRIAGGTVDQVTVTGQRLPALCARGAMRGIAAGHGHLLALYRNGDQELFGGAPLTSQWFKPAKSSTGESDERVERLMLSSDGRYAHASVEPGTSETPGYDVAWRLVDGKSVGTGLALTDLPAAANRVVAADARAHRLAVWDFDRNDAIARLPRHRSRDTKGAAMLLQAAISDDGRRVASASPDGLVRVWDINAHRLIGEARVVAAVTAMAFDAPGRQLAVGRADGRVWVLETP